MSQPTSDPAIASQVTMALLPDESSTRMYGHRPGMVCRTGRPLLPQQDHRCAGVILRIMLKGQELVKDVHRS
jgi:hypothetical protein